LEIRGLSGWGKRQRNKKRGIVYKDADMDCRFLLLLGRGR